MVILKLLSTLLATLGNNYDTFDFFLISDLKLWLEDKLTIFILLTKQYMHVFPCVWCTCLYMNYSILCKSTTFSVSDTSCTTIMINVLGNLGTTAYIYLKLYTIWNLIQHQRCNTQIHIIRKERRVCFRQTILINHNEHRVNLPFFRKMK